MAHAHNALFTPTEAAILSGLSLKAVNNAIDTKTIDAKARGPLLDLRALLSLLIVHRLSATIAAPKLRRQVFDALAETPRHTISLKGGLITIDLSEPRRALAASLRDLRRVRRLVVTDPKTLGGDPVFCCTRVPVHMIARLIAKGSTPAELIEGYPRLTAEMILLAPIYLAAYPLRGRSRSQPWRDRTLEGLERRPLHQQRSEEVLKANASRSQKQSEYVREWQAAKTPEQRSAAVLKGWATRRLRAAAKVGPPPPDSPSHPV
jgi:uncharacterized protein (DUF433 family)